MIRSDRRNKEIALGRIKRLASSGLPLEPFSRALFELLNDAIPHSPNRLIQVAGEDIGDFVFGATPEMLAVLPAYYHHYFEKPETSGSKIAEDPLTLRRVWVQKDVWTQDEVALPDAYRWAGYNEVWRRIGWHHFLQCVLQEEGRFVGRYPLWRTCDQKPFVREDVEFLRAAAPHITHGLRVSQLMTCDAAGTSDGFTPLPGWNSGVLLLEPTGKVIAIDGAARSIFLQLGSFDGLRAEAFESKPMQEALSYVTHTLGRIFGDSGEWLNADAPVCRVHLHRTGITLRLRGVMMSGSDGRDHISVLVERGETAEHRFQRITARWGLSEREAEVLAFIGDGKTGPEIAILLGIGHDTVRKHTSRVFEKLGVETRAAAASIAREAMAVADDGNTR
jgi:DNA-binding CsgD family transcriptional regulator